MFNAKLYLPMGALFLLNFLPASAGLKCAGCDADVFVDMMEKIDENRECWLTVKYQFLSRLQTIALEEINDNMILLHDSINQVVDEKCKTEVQLKSCPMTDKQELSQCLMDNLKTLGYNYRDQEKCHGKRFEFELLDLLFGQMFSYFDAMAEIMPEC